MALKQEFSAVVDIGSTKITALAGEINESGKIEILGKACVPSKGIKRGVVLNPEEFAGALRTLISQLEAESGGNIRVVDVSMAGQGVITQIYEGIRYIESGLVEQSDVEYLEKEASNMPLEPGYKIYHIFPRKYEIGEDPDVQVPVGHEGRKLVALYTLITAPSSYRESVEKALSRASVQLGKFVLSPLSAAEAVISEEEKDLGVVLIDLGGGTSKMITFTDGKLTHMAVIPFAGDVITRDIKEGCSILLKWAEQLKVQYGQAIGDFAAEEKMVTIPGHNGWEPKEISFKTLAYIIQARLEEIIDSIYFQIEKSGFLNHGGQGIILTGGTATMTNLLHLVKFRTGLDARPGYSQIRLSRPFNSENIDFTTALGLLKLSLSNNRESKSPKPIKNRPVRESSRDGKSVNGFLSNLQKKMSQQISILFEEDDASI